MNDDLAARRDAVLERVARKRRQALEQARQADEIDGTAAAILASRRKHPSNVRPYDFEQEENQ